MNKLIIDTALREQITVGIKIEGKTYRKTQKTALRNTQAGLALINRLLNQHGVGLKDLQAIEVNEGPGSFTGVRIGAAIANALSFALKIPVNNKKTGELVEPKYK